VTEIYTEASGIPSDQHYVTDSEGRLYYRNVRCMDGEWVMDDHSEGRMAIDEPNLLAVFGPCRPAERGDNEAVTARSSWMTETLTW
jgi:hypothetical protein